MARCAAELNRRSTVDLVCLFDHAAETSVEIAPALGANCVAFRVGRGPGKAWRVLDEPPSDEGLARNPFRCGAPILFPWPNRITSGRFVYRGRQYALAASAPGGHAIHGLVHSREWEVERLAAGDEAALVRCGITIEPDDGHPFHARLAVSYRLAGATLSIEAEATNTGRAPMPMGFGVHPWFTLPMAPGGTRRDCLLTVPAASRWELSALIPTGAIVPAEGEYDFTAERPLDDLILDDVFTGLRRVDGWCRSRIRDPVDGRAVEVRADDRFREIVVYAPANRDVVCLEPYTCPTDAFNLANRGLDAGLIELGPGESWHGTIEIEARLGDNRR